MTDPTSPLGASLDVFADAVAAAESQARAQHDAGTCHRSQWSCSFCEEAVER